MGTICKFYFIYWKIIWSNSLKYCCAIWMDQTRGLAFRSWRWGKNRAIE